MREESDLRCAATVMHAIAKTLMANGKTGPLTFSLQTPTHFPFFFLNKKKVNLKRSNHNAKQTKRQGKKRQPHYCLPLNLALNFYLSLSH